MAKVRYSKVTHRYPGVDLPSVDNFDLDIADGDFLVLVGPSGCGKSTTLRLLAGLESVESGSITIGDADVTAARVTAIRLHVIARVFGYVVMLVVVVLVAGLLLFVFFTSFKHQPNFCTRMP
jgi:ABC-type sugar transport system ATPase subunit